MSSAGDITTESESLPSCSHISSSDDENLPKNMFQHKKAPFFKSNLNDTFDRQIELKSLQAQLAQLELELSSERENTISFRKKLTQANKEKFEQAARFNEEACKLHTQNAALQAKIEQQSEFTEHLEFELDKNRKQLEKEQKAAGTRAVSNAHSIEQLEELLNDARAKISSLESQNEQNKRSMSVQVEQLKETIADRDRILRETVQEQQNVIAERNTLNEVIQQQQETIGEHRNQFTDLKIELDKVKEHLAEANARVKSLTVSEQDYREQLEVVQQNSKELSEAIEAEKTSHLESKFNSELVQLKINDLENSMQHQKVVNDGLQENVDTLSGQLRELEKAYNDELSLHRATKSKLDKYEKDYMLSQRQLQAELTDKRTLVTNLKQQLDMHQSNVDDLKTELNRARKRQQYFEETYGGSMRELELLVANFGTVSPHSSSREAMSQDGDKPMSPSAILDTIKHTLRIYKQNLEDTTDQLKKLSSTYETTSKENTSTKDKLWAKQKALEDAQQSLSQANKDADALRKTTLEQEQRLSSLKDDLYHVKKEYDTLQAKYTGLGTELTNAKMVHLQQNEVKMRFIHGLYQRLLLPTLAAKVTSKQGKEKPLEKFKWEELSEMVLEQSMTLLSQLQNLQERLPMLEKELQSRDERMDAKKEEYELELSKMSAILKESNDNFDREREAMQQEYRSLQEGGHRQQEMSQKAYDETWEQLRQTTSDVEHLQKEAVDLKSRISMLQKHNSSLLCAFALMCGAYYPLLSRSKKLAKQRNILEEQLLRLSEFKKQVCVLLQTLSSEGLGGHPVMSGSNVLRQRSLFKFRRAVLAVIAARRLRMGASGAHPVFTYTDFANMQAVVCLGSLKCAKRKKKLCDSSQKDPPETSVLSESDIIDWLSNKDVISIVMSCTEDVMEALKRYSHKEKGCQPGFVVSAARTTLKKLIGRLETLYVGGDPEPLYGAHQERLTVGKRLNRGLHDLMATCSLEQKLHLLPSTNILTSLQERVLSFIKLLHDSEMERKRLKTKVAALSSSEQQLRQVEQSAENFELEIAVLRNQAERMVSVDKYDSVVGELNHTLEREKQAQRLLAEQSDKLRDISHRLTEEEAIRVKHESQIQESLKSLEDGKSDAMAKSNTIQHLKSRVSKLELERTQLQNNVYDAEEALKMAAKEKEYLGIYIRSLTTAFDKCRSDITTKDVSTIMNSKALLPECKLSGDLLSLQSLVNAFTDALRAAHNHMSGLNDEICSHRKHIARLKDELSAACRRQLDAPSEMPCSESPKLVPRGEDYNRLQSTRLGHYQDKDITPRFDKSIDLERRQLSNFSVTDFMSMQNEPEFSNGDENSIKNHKKFTSTELEVPKKPATRLQSSSFRPPSNTESRLRKKHNLR